MRVDKTFFKEIPRHLEEIVPLQRKKHHPKLHEIHVKHGISKKTLFYIKEYGAHSHMVSVILKESFLIMVLASVLSSVGGIGLQTIQEKIFVIVPLLIFIPALNGFVGNLGITISSKFTTSLYLGETEEKRKKKMAQLVRVVYVIALFLAAYLTLLSCTVAYLKGYEFNLLLFFKIMLIAVSMTLVMTTVIFAVSMALGKIIFRRGEDPNNFLIPITTSIADLGCLAFFTAFVSQMF